jgi:hypothetical protein
VGESWRGELLLPQCGRAVVAELCGRALVGAVWASCCCREMRVLLRWVHGVDERDVRVFAKGCEKGRLCEHSRRAKKL